MNIYKIIWSSYLAIGFKESFTPGAASKELNPANEVPVRIETGAIEGLINIYLYHRTTSNKDLGMTQFPINQIFIWRSDLTKNRPLRDGTLTHELLHVFGATGQTDSTWLDSWLNWLGLSAVIAESQAYSTEGAFRSGILVYGVDWTDDFRKESNSTWGGWNPAGSGDKGRITPTIYDLLRLSARTIRDQTKGR